MSSITINIHGPATITAAEATPSAPVLPVPVDHPSAELVADLANHQKAIETIGTLVGGDPEDLRNVVAEVREHVERTRDLSIRVDELDQQVIAAKKTISEGLTERKMIAAALGWQVGGDLDLLQHAQRIGGEVIRLKEELRLAKQDRAQKADEMEAAAQRAVAAEKRADELAAQAAQLRGDLARVGEELAIAQASPSGVDARQVPDEPRPESNPGSADSPGTARSFEPGEVVIFAYPSGEHFALCKVVTYDPDTALYGLTYEHGTLANIPASDLRAAEPLEVKRLRDAGLITDEAEAQPATEEKPKRRRRTKAEIEAEKAQAEAEQQPQEPSTESQETPVVAEEQAPGTGLECREFLLAYLAENQAAIIDEILNETFGRYTTDQVHAQLKQLAEEGTIELAGAEPMVVARLAPGAGQTPAEQEQATRHQGPLEADRPMPQPNPAAPAEVQAVTKAIALLKQLPPAEFEPGEPVMTITEEGEIVSGVIEKAFPGTTKLQVKTQAGMQHPDADLVRARRLIYTTPGGDEIGCLVDEVKEGVAAVTFDGGNYSPGVPIKSLRAYAATTAQAS